jgi:hypothetical protein
VSVLPLHAQVASAPVQRAGGADSAYAGHGEFTCSCCERSDDLPKWIQVVLCLCRAVPPVRFPPSSSPAGIFMRCRRGQPSTSIRQRVYR